MTKEDKDQSADEWHHVASESEIAPEEPKAVEVNRRHIGIYKIADRYFAMADICSHQFAYLSSGYVDGEYVECPLHAARFHIPTGRVTSELTEKDMETFEVVVRNGEIYLRVPKETD